MSRRRVYLVHARCNGGGIWYQMYVREPIKLRNGRDGVGGGRGVEADGHRIQKCSNVTQGRGTRKVKEYKCWANRKITR